MTKRLLRSRTDRYVAGVCGGLGDYFEVDSAFVRLLFALAAFAGGTGVLAYVVLWFTVPEEPVSTSKSINQEIPMEKKKEPAAPLSKESKRERGGALGGIILIVLGLLFLADNFLPGFDFGHLWPVLLVAIGLGILLRGNQR